jgi:hypothetical protein
MLKKYFLTDFLRIWTYQDEHCNENKDVKEIVARASK